MKYFSDKKIKWISGKTYKKKILLEDIKDKINLIEDVIIKPLGEVPLHKHQYTKEVFYITEGKPIFRNTKKNIQLKEEELIFIDKEEAHGFINKTKRRVKLICFKINHRKGDSYLS